MNNNKCIVEQRHNVDTVRRKKIHEAMKTQQWNDHPTCKTIILSPGPAALVIKEVKPFISIV
jgi:anthranilate/para-aminobenzoate synthase component II